jgi:D-sedoheptulose 7-phosphate isomerase
MTKKQIVKLLIKTFESGGKVLICGNGGSASMAQHMAAELVCKFRRYRRALPAIALTTDTSILTAWGNDEDFTDAFARQVEALGNKGDILIAISTSGKSKNVLAAIEVAEFKEVQVVIFPIKGRFTPRIQEYQLRLMHDIVQEVEDYFS